MPRDLRFFWVLPIPRTGFPADPSMVTHARYQLSRCFDCTLVLGRPRRLVCTQPTLGLEPEDAISHGKHQQCFVQLKGF